MHAVTKILLLAVTVPAVLCYDEKYDSIDVDKILADEKLFDAYISCLLDKGPCEVEHSTEFKKLLPEVIETACAKCSAIQKDHVRKSVRALHFKKPAEFEEFRRKYDPKGEHQAKFTEFIIGTDS